MLLQSAVPKCQMYDINSGKCRNVKQVSWWKLPHYAIKITCFTHEKYLLILWQDFFNTSFGKKIERPRDVCL